MPNSLLVGIDVSSSDNKVRLLDSSGDSLSKFSVSNNQPGAKTLVYKIVSAMTLNHFNSLVIGLEATSVYGRTSCPFLETRRRYRFLQTQHPCTKPQAGQRFQESLLRPAQDG